MHAWHFGGKPSVMVMYCIILPSSYLNPLCTAKVVLEKYSIQSMNSTGTPKLALLFTFGFHDQIFKQMRIHDIYI